MAKGNKNTRSLNEEEMSKLDELNSIVKEQLKNENATYYKLGIKLTGIRDLLKNTDQNFKDYYKREFNLAHAQVYRYMDHASIRNDIGETDTSLSFSERLLRPLTPYDAENRKKIWEAAKAMAGGIPTAEQLQKALGTGTMKAKKSRSTARGPKFFSRVLNSNVNLDETPVANLLTDELPIEKSLAFVREVQHHNPLSAEELKAVKTALTGALDRVIASIIPTANEK